MSAEKEIPSWLQDIVNQLPDADGEELIRRWTADQLRIQELRDSLGEALDLCRYFQKWVDDWMIGEYQVVRNTIGKYDVFAPNGADLGSYSFLGAVGRVMKHEKASRDE